jgi:mRNA-degrading endonuclease RelE of RelBE toxin-antitoxin system
VAKDMITSSETSLPSNYQCHETTEFSKAFRKLDKKAQKIIDETIQDVLLLQPYESKG